MSAPREAAEQARRDQVRALMAASTGRRQHASMPASVPDQVKLTVRLPAELRTAVMVHRANTGESAQDLIIRLLREELCV